MQNWIYWKTYAKNEKTEQVFLAEVSLVMGATSKEEWGDLPWLFKKLE